MELPDQAALALDVVRRDGRDLRFEVTEICRSGRYRLSVRYRARGGDEVRLGLLYSPDAKGLEDLGARLAAG